MKAKRLEGVPLNRWPDRQMTAVLPKPPPRMAR
jgi:hypothetical protein